MEWLIGAIVSAVAILVSSVVSGVSNKRNVTSQESMNSQNIAYQQEANQQNIELQREQNAQNQANVEKNWEREDTAYQRKAADLAAAGLSPHLAAGGSGASTSSPISLNAPQISAPQGRAVKSDVSGLISSLSVLGQLGQSIGTMKQTDMATKGMAIKNEEELQRLRFDAEMNPLRFSHQQKINNQLDDVSTQMVHNINYAVKHNLPVGTSDVQLRRLEFLFDKLKDLKSLWDDKGPGVLSNLGDKFGNVSAGIGTTAKNVWDNTKAYGSNLLDQFKQDFPIPSFVGGKALDLLKYGIGKSPFGTFQRAAQRK